MQRSISCRALLSFPDERPPTRSLPFEDPAVSFEKQEMKKSNEKVKNTPREGREDRKETAKNVRTSSSLSLEASQMSRAFRDLAVLEPLTAKPSKELTIRGRSAARSRKLYVRFYTYFFRFSC